MTSNCSVMFYQVPGNLCYLLEANNHLHHKMKGWARNPGISCKFCFERAVLVSVGSLEKCPQSRSVNEPGAGEAAAGTGWRCHHPAQRLVLLFLLTSRCDLWLIPFTSLSALVSSYPLIALSPLELSLGCQLHLVRCLRSAQRNRTDLG